MSTQKNPDVKALAEREWLGQATNGQSVTSVEWREVLSGFAAFPYADEESRQSDFEAMLMTGFAVLGREGLWEEVMSLADSALSNEEFVARSRMVLVICSHKAMAYIALGQSDLALQNDLNVAPPTEDALQQSICYALGYDLFHEVKERQNDGEGAIAAPVLVYAHRLFARYKPNIPLPKVLEVARMGEVRESPLPTWNEVQTALVEALGQ